MINRRNFLKGLGIAPMVPAIIRTSDDIPMPTPDPTAFEGGRFIALFKEVSEDVPYIVEVNASDYARLQILEEHFQPNSIDVLFPQAQESWGTIVGAHLYDAPIGGNVLLTSTFSAPRVVGHSDQLLVSLRRHLVGEHYA